jgi:rhomboid protease GluP
VVEEQELEFIRAFWTRRTVTAYALFGLNIIIFLMMTFAGGSENPATMLAFGVKSNFEINNGEVWRFITPIFLHIGLLHLAFNSYALWIVGPQVEKLYGSARFLLLYMLTGIAGVAASYWYHPNIPSAGASGAIFGLFGVLLVFSFKYRKTIPEFFSRALGKGVLMTVGINLVIGFMIPQVDNSAHIGGLIAGGVLAFVVPFQRPGEEPRKMFKVIEAVLVLTIGVSFFQVATHYNGPPFSSGNFLRGFRSGSSGTIWGYLDAVTRSEAAFEYSEAALTSGNAAEISASIKNVGDAVELLKRAPSVSRRADKIAEDLLDVMQKQYSYLQTVERTGKRDSDIIGPSPQSRRYARIRREFETWVNEEGKNYGIVNKK